MSDGGFRQTIEGHTIREKAMVCANIAMMLPISSHSRIFSDGEWKDDKKEGKGVLEYNHIVKKGKPKDGRKKYEGGWKQDQFHGQGVGLFCTRALVDHHFELD